MVEKIHNKSRLWLILLVVFMLRCLEYIKWKVIPVECIIRGVCKVISLVYVLKSQNHLILIIYNLLVYDSCYLGLY